MPQVWQDYLGTFWMQTQSLQCQVIYSVKNYTNWDLQVTKIEISGLYNCVLGVFRSIKIALGSSKIILFNLTYEKFVETSVCDFDRLPWQLYIKLYI